jgi:hypothetical protein
VDAIVAGVGPQAEEIAGKRSNRVAASGGSEVENLSGMTGKALLARDRKQRLEQARLADARFAADIDRPTPPVRPAGAEHDAELFKLQAPADERSAVGAQRIRPALLVVCTYDLPGWNEFAKPLEGMAAELAIFELAARQAARALRNNNGVWFGQSLEPRREVRRLADDAALLSHSRSNQIADDNNAGRNADACLQYNRRLQCADGRDQLQTCAHRALGVILVGSRIAKIHEHPVAHVLRDETTEAAHGISDAFLIGRNDLS